MPTTENGLPASQVIEGLAEPSTNEHNNNNNNNNHAHANENGDHPVSNNDLSSSPNRQDAEESPVPRTTEATPWRDGVDGGRSETARGRGLCDRLHRRHKASLSRAPTTPCNIAVLIPLLSLLAHGMFLYGQTVSMWRLQLYESVDIWANATNFESRTFLDSIGMQHHLHFQLEDDRTVREFSFSYAITELWKAVGLPGKVLPRTAAILLVAFSGVWPHLKLLLLQGTWFLSSSGVRRTRILSWLGTLGKWSLSDVLVVCVMVGIVHLDFVIRPAEDYDRMIQNLPAILGIVNQLYTPSDLCSILLPIDCHVKHESFKKWSECKVCVGAVKSVLEHPDQARSTFQGVLDGMHVGGPDGLISLRIFGMRGIYSFCLAVILSILISLVVDILDIRQKQARAEVTASYENQTMDSTEAGMARLHTTVRTDDHDLSLSLLVHNGQITIPVDSSNESAVGIHVQRNRWRSLFIALVCIITNVLVISAVGFNSMARRLHGAIPNALRETIELEWDRNYSFWTLVGTTGAAGGYDYLFMGTFALFIVVGPVLRALACFVASQLTEGSVVRRRLMTFIDLIGAFCAWEVFCVAVIMVDMLMPAITRTVLQKDECAEISPEDGRACLEVEFNLLPDQFSIIVAGGLTLLCVSNIFFNIRGNHPQVGYGAIDFSRRYHLVPDQGGP